MILYLTLFLALRDVVESTTATTTTTTSVIQRPEAVLFEFLARPFEPTHRASINCLRDSKIYLQELSNYNPWALKMYDASAKIPPGLINGNVQQLGNYDECLQIKTGHTFRAQACSASVQFEILKGSKKSAALDMKDLLVQVAKAANLKSTPDRSVSFEWMWCMPSSCNHSELSGALELALDPLKVDGRLDFTVSVSEHSCHTVVTDKQRFDAIDWFYTGTLATFLVIIAASTIYDLHCVEHENKEELKRKGVSSRHSLLTSFSIYKNGRKLLSTKRHGDTITCLDGIRFLSICWIIFGHTFFMEVVGVKMDKSHVPKLHEDWTSMFVLNGNIGTDIFFLLSGLLLAYTFLSKYKDESDVHLNLPCLYLNRYFRLTPAYAVVIGFYATLFDKLGSGPKWDNAVHQSKLDCRDNWWTNLLYVNNYVNIGNMCLSQSWYLSVDMQLFIFSPIFLYAMLKFHQKTIFWTLTVLSILISILVPFFLTYFLHLTGTMLYYKNSQDVINVYLQIYTRVYARAGPYIIGLAFGYTLFKTKSYKMRISKVYILAGWLLAIIAAMSAILVPRGMYYDDYTYNQLEASFYAGLHRHLFALAISWIIFACVNGYAGPLNSFLSWCGWSPLSKLSYSAYLTHYIVLQYNVGTTRTASNLTTFTSVHAFFGNLCLTMFISLALCCCFEMPFLVLTRWLFEPRKSREGGRLATKPSTTELIFGSSIENIGRSTENIAVDLKTGSLDSVFVISKFVKPENREMSVGDVVVDEIRSQNDKYTDVG